MRDRIKKLLEKTRGLYKLASFFYRCLRRAAGALFCLCPVRRNKIVFDQFCGKGYGAFPAHVADALLSAGISADYVWLCAGDPGALPAAFRTVKYGSLRALYETVTAGVWIDNVMGALDAPKRKGQLYINTWHGTGVGLKKIEADVEEYLEPAYVRGAKKDAGKIDYLLSSSRYQDSLVGTTFWYAGKTLPVEYTGVKTAAERAETAQRVRAFFGLAENVKIVFYAPTFRQNDRTDCYDVNFPALLSALSERFGGEWKALVRLHPNAARLQDVIAYSQTVLNATAYPDIDELVYASDLLITDFSSSFFDAMRYGKRSLLYASDYDEYVKNERPLCFDVRTLPPPFAGDNDALRQAVLSYDDEAYFRGAKEFVDRVGYYSDKKDLSAPVDVIRRHLSEQ